MCPEREFPTRCRADGAVNHVLQVLPEVVSRLLWDVGFPCLLAASIIIQYTFSELSQVGCGGLSAVSLVMSPAYKSLICCCEFIRVGIYNNKLPSKCKISNVIQSIAQSSWDSCPTSEYKIACG